MNKKFLWTFVVLIFCSLGNNLYAPAPGPQAWLDDQRQEAPACVRRAANELWDAVEAEGQCWCNVGYGAASKPSNWKKYKPLMLENILGCACSGATFCILPIICCLCCDEDGEYVIGQHNYNNSQDEVAASKISTVVVERWKEALWNAVNVSVKNPENFVNDRPAFQLGYAVQDGRAVNRSCTMPVNSVSRNMTDVPSSIKTFVNAHGGWR